VLGARKLRGKEAEALEGGLTNGAGKKD